VASGCAVATPALVPWAILGFEKSGRSGEQPLKGRIQTRIMLVRKAVAGIAVAGVEIPDSGVA